MRPESGFQIAPNWLQIGKIAMTSQLSEMMSSSNVFDVVLFPLSSLVSDTSFMLISSLLQEL